MASLEEAKVAQEQLKENLMTGIVRLGEEDQYAIRISIPAECKVPVYVVYGPGNVVAYGDS